jgi:hypothetical protein
MRLSYAIIPLILDNEVAVNTGSGVAYFSNITIQ